MGRGTVMTALALAGLAAPREAAACSFIPADAFALPGPGATEVSTAASLVIVASRAQPANLELRAGGVLVPTDGVELMGTGIAGPYGAIVSYWRVRGPQLLMPNTEYILAGDVAGVRSTLSAFTTGPGYDKAPGTPAVLRGVRFWRVRYPTSEIASGNCVFAEYHTFVSLDWTPGSVPGTPDDALIHEIDVTPRPGGAGHSLFTHGPRFVGMVPEGSHPTPDLRVTFDLDPTQEHCVTIRTLGYDARSRLPAVSNTMCAAVTSLSTVGSGGDAGVASDDAGVPAADAGSGDGGCSVGGGEGEWLAALAWLAARRRR